MTATQQDIALWDAFLEGDRDSFSQLFRNYYPLLHKYGSKICPDAAILEDCIQELFTELWVNRNARPVSSIKAYLLKALKYKLLKVLGKKKNIVQADRAGDGLLFEISHENFLIARQENEEKARKVISALGQLSHRQKEIIYLKFYQDLSYEEVSEIMNINYQVARNLLYQAIKALRNIMNHASSLLLLI